LPPYKEQYVLCHIFGLIKGLAKALYSRFVGFVAAVIKHSQRHTAAVMPAVYSITAVIYLFSDGKFPGSFTGGNLPYAVRASVFYLLIFYRIISV
jgi:hypothetical protein